MTSVSSRRPCSAVVNWWQLKVIKWNAVLHYWNSNLIGLTSIHQKREFSWTGWKESGSNIWIDFSSGVIIVRFHWCHEDLTAEICLIYNEVRAEAITVISGDKPRSSIVPQGHTDANYAISHNWSLKHRRMKLCYVYQVNEVLSSDDESPPPAENPPRAKKLQPSPPPPLPPPPPPPPAKPPKVKQLRSRGSIDTSPISKQLQFVQCARYFRFYYICERVISISTPLARLS